MSPGAVIYLLWGLGFLGWVAAAALSEREPGTLHGVLGFAYHAVALVAVLMLLSVVRPFPGTDLQYPLWPRGVPDALGWVLAALTLAGFAITAWASEHRIACQRRGVRRTETGPYAIVRHPVYLGLAVAALATALSAGQLTAFLGAGLLIAAQIAKVMVEERATGDEAARAYRKRVPMFVPFWPMSKGKN